MSSIYFNIILKKKNSAHYIKSKRLKNYIPNSDVTGLPAIIKPMLPIITHGHRACSSSRGSYPIAEDSCTNTCYTPELCERVRLTTGDTLRSADVVKPIQ